MSKTIPLTQNQVAIVCDCHYHLVSDKKWYAVWNTHAKVFYAERSTSILERMAGAPKTIRMHAAINGTPKEMHTDHINHDTLDNRCSNLRTATYSQNQMNQGKRADNTSGYKGVYWDNHGKKWRAQIKFDGKRKTLGGFDTPEDAARAYQTAAKELHGEFARTE